MTTMADELEFGRASRRIERILACVAVAGTALAGAAGGWKWAAGFLAGSAAAWFNFRWLKRLVSALGGERDAFLVPVGAAVLPFRRMRLCYSTVFSDTSAVSVIAGMLVLVVAIFIEILFELVYARKRTLDHQDL